MKQDIWPNRNKKSYSHVIHVLFLGFFSVILFQIKHLSIDKLPCSYKNIIYFIHARRHWDTLFSQCARLPLFHLHSQKTAFFSVEQTDFIIHCNKSTVRVTIFSDLQYPQLDAKGAKSNIYDRRITQTHHNVWWWPWIKRTHNFWTTSKSTFNPRWRCYFHFPMLITLEILLNKLSREQAMLTSFQKICKNPKALWGCVPGYVCVSIMYQMFTLIFWLIEGRNMIHL